MLTSILVIILGLVFLVLGGELLVRSASKIALKLGISPLIIGLTIVSLGTSAPELGVSLFAAFDGNPEIALSNVVGSNIFNLGFILGLCAILSPLVVNLQLIRLDVPILIAATIMTYVFSLDGQISQYEGGTLFAGALAYTAWLVRASTSEATLVKTEFNKVHDNDLTFLPKDSILLHSLFVILSVAVLVGGSRLLVTGAVNIATFLGVSSTLIGLTIVAIGTSLPEVATSVMATLKGQSDMAVGNVIGSNIFNIMLILGLSSAVNSGLTVERTITQFDLPFMIGLSLLCYPFLVTARKLVRWEGLLLFGGYAVYTFILINRG